MNREARPRSTPSPGWRAGTAVNAGTAVKLVGSVPTVKGSQMARTVREQQDKRREEKLKQVQEQVDDGSLVIRKMTQKERKANPPKPRKEKKKR